MVDFNDQVVLVSGGRGNLGAAVVRTFHQAGARVIHQGINVNAVLPGTLDTPQNRQAMPDADFSLWVTPQAMAQVILFLASQGADPIHGALIPVYGRK
jgi:NAD(P)-dependent dehydrogenase (short-subunit alcohol dehydrogenase family)